MINDFHVVILVPNDGQVVVWNLSDSSTFSFNHRFGSKLLDFCSIHHFQEGGYIAVEQHSDFKHTKLSVAYFTLPLTPLSQPVHEYECE